MAKKIKTKVASLLNKAAQFPLYVLDWNKKRKDRRDGHLR